MSTPALNTLAPLIQARAQAQHAQAVAWRRHMHRNAELSFQEFDTADFLERELRQVEGLALHRPTPTSLVATLRGGLPGRVLAIRADIDALPIQDQKTCDYASTRAGAMHACGHDGHAAMLLGTVHLLAGLRERPVKLLVQLAEKEKTLVVPGRILSAQQFHGAVSAGIQFDELDDESSLCLKAHMAEWM